MLTFNVYLLRVDIPVSTSKLNYNKVRNSQTQTQQLFQKPKSILEPKRVFEPGKKTTHLDAR